MRLRFYYVFTTLFFVCLIRNSSYPQWVQTNGPEGGYVQSITTSDSNLLAGVEGRGIFVTSNDGNTWTLLQGNGFPNDAKVVSIYARGSLLLAGLDQGGLLRSSDGGANWTAPITSGTWTSIIAADTFLLASGWYESGIVRSSDDGITWTAINSGFSSLFIWNMIVQGANVFAAIESDGIHRSTDYGDHWQPSNSGVDNYSPHAFAVQDSILFVGTGGGGVYRSTNKGATWKSVNVGLSLPLVQSLGTDGTTLFAGTWGAGIFRSSDNGDSWVEANEGVFGKVIWAFATKGPNVFAGTQNGGIFRSSNNGLTWTPSNTGIVGTDVTVLTTKGGNLFAGTYGGGVHRTSDSGTHWQSVGLGLNSSMVLSLCAQDSQLFAGTFQGGIYVSSDDGKTWNESNNGLTDTNVYSLASDESGLYAGTGQNGLYKSTDRGSSWSLIYGIGDVTIVFAAPSVLLVGTQFVGLYVSYNGGHDWNQVSLAGYEGPIDCITASESTLFASRRGPGGGVYRSIDGLNWTLYNAGLPKPDFAPVAFATTSDYVFAGYYGQGVYFTKDEIGGVWQEANLGLGDPFINSLALDGEYLYAATLYHGVWRRPLSDLLTGMIQPPAAPFIFSLAQNYPNPFNPSTTIKYELPKVSHVSLSVYDILGREVATLMNEVKEPGTYTVKFDGSNLASGVYFYRLRAGDYVSTKKLLLMR